MQKRLLIRPKKGRMFLGVCAAIAHYLRIPVALVRVAWLFLLVPGGLPGLIPYFLLWLMIPSEKTTASIS